MTGRVLLVCGSLQTLTANSAALDVAQKCLNKLAAPVHRYNNLTAIPAFNPDVEPVADATLSVDAPPALVKATLLASGVGHEHFAGSVER